MSTINALFQLGMILIAILWFFCIELAWKTNRKELIYYAMIITILYVMIGSVVIDRLGR